MSTGSDEPTHGREYPPLENSTPPVDPHAPVDYPTEQPHGYWSPADFQQPGNPPLEHQQSGYPPLDYQQPGHPPPDYQQPGHPPPGYPQPGYPQAGYPPPGMQPPGYPPQYQGGYAYDPYAPAQPMGTNGKAIASLVTSLAGLFFCGVPSIVGVILGVLAMREIRRTGQEGHGMALAGVIVGALAVVGWIVYVVVIILAVAVTSTPTYGY